MAKDDDAIPLDEDALPLEVEAPVAAAGAATGRPNIQSFGSAAGLAHGQTQFKRAPNLTGTGAIRCRMFHSKLAVGAIEFMTQQVNDWLDANQIEAKHVSQVVGVMEGKTPEPNIIVIVWY